MIVILDAVILVDLGVGIFLSSVITSCAGLELVNHPSCFTSLLFFKKILATKILATKLTSNYFSLKKWNIKKMEDEKITCNWEYHHMENPSVKFVFLI